MTHTWNRIGTGGRHHHPRRRRANKCWGQGDIIRAAGALCGGTVIRSGKGERLSCRASTLEFVAEVLKVFVTDLPLLHLFDHRSEVCQ